MSANLLVDLGNTCLLLPSLPGAVVASPSGFVAGLSGQLVGAIADMANADTNTQVLVQGRSVTSGPLLIGVQTSDSTASGSFTDPTSGLPPYMPSWFSSGGWMIIGQSGTSPGTRNAGDGVSGQYLLSGFCESAHFLRPHRYARLILGSGFYDGDVAGCFIGNLRTTGSGGGFSHSPASSGQPVSV